MEYQLIWHKKVRCVNFSKRIKGATSKGAASSKNVFEKMMQYFALNTMIYVLILTVSYYDKKNLKIMMKDGHLNLKVTATKARPIYG